MAVEQVDIIPVERGDIVVLEDAGENLNILGIIEDPNLSYGTHRVRIVRYGVPESSQFHVTRVIVNYGKQIY